MFPPFEPDPGWFERYWYSNRLEPKRRSLSPSLARLAVLVALLATGGLVLSKHHVQRDVSSGLQDWEQE
jgi:hypothetical protein